MLNLFQHPTDRYTPFTCDPPVIWGAETSSAWREIIQVANIPKRVKARRWKSFWLKSGG
ncbi:MAG: hypothetical protein ACTHNW_19395 [Mucilaginibacter sp.]